MYEARSEPATLGGRPRAGNPAVLRERGNSGFGAVTSCMKLSVSTGGLCPLTYFLVHVLATRTEGPKLSAAEKTTRPADGCRENCRVPAYFVSRNVRETFHAEVVSTMPSSLSNVSPDPFHMSAPAFTW